MLASVLAVVVALLVVVLEDVLFAVAVVQHAVRAVIVLVVMSWCS